LDKVISIRKLDNGGNEVNDGVRNQIWTPTIFGQKKEAGRREMKRTFWSASAFPGLILDGRLQQRLSELSMQELPAESPGFPIP